MGQPDNAFIHQVSVMKKMGSFYVMAVTLGLFFAARSHATVIVTNTFIAPIDLTYDGTDLVVSNCTVTVDGAHSFNSLAVTNGGVITHSYLPNGSSTALNPVLDEPHILTGTNPVTLLFSNLFSPATVTSTNIFEFYTNGVDYIQADLAGGGIQIYRTATSSIPDGATVLVTYVWTYSYNAGLYLNITNDLNVASGGSINLNGNGFGPATGTGRGITSVGPFPDGSGAGHGGNGGISASNAIGGVCYGSLYQPTTLGSGGGASYAGTGGNGGGKVQITAGGTVNIDGVISANGADATNSRAGGGAGGSIWIIATNVTGTGTVMANGGAGEPIRGGGGGGGRISIQSGTNTFAGTLAAYGGIGSKTGGAGTVYTQTNGQTGLVIVDNGGRNGTNSSITLTTTADVLIRNGAKVKPDTFNPRNLTIGTNGTMYPPSASVYSLTVSGDMTIQAGGIFSLDSFGSAPGFGSTPGTSYSTTYYPGGGGGHGGNGGNSYYFAAIGGGTSDSQTSPTVLGSGGGNATANGSFGGAGGGALQLNVTGNLRVDGSLSANGGNGSGSGGGGGAGGSINISHCLTLSGGGSITANGGSGVASFGGGGGGGRIAIYPANNNFTGTISAYGGSGVNYGGAGTIYTQAGAVQQLILDNGGHSGTNTPVQTQGNASLIVQNGARALAGSATFNSLLVASNGWLVHTPAGSSTLTVLNNATIQAGGGFMGDLLGRSSGQGSGTGTYSASSPYGGGGAAYGGRGGNAFSNTAAGGTFAGDAAASPSSAYSGSGGAGISPSVGGNGGGYLQLTVSGTLQLDGFITANAGSGSGPGGGGGAGGGIALTVGTLSGGGSISANGGSGANGIGGGGGGGRIAVTFNTYNFTGSLSAIGGGGANYGGAGTIYLKTNFNSRAQIIVDNAGHVGADTTGINGFNADVFLRNGSMYYPLTGTSAFGNLTVGSNSAIVISNSTFYSSATFSAANVTVQPGGRIIADFNGYAPGSGSGYAAFQNLSPLYAGGGGGHGGFGGGSISNLAAGGSAFDSASSPTGPGGGGGGNNSFTSAGGHGGGLITFTLSGNLQVDGTLSANGANGSGIGGGGGAGGGLSISCVMLTGNGMIAANGGNGANTIGGGGAGGMIYASFTSNIFSGTVSAFGGNGASYGGAGTIFWRTNLTGQTLLVLDNAGHRGTNTPLPFANNFILRNGASAIPTAAPQVCNNLLIASNAWVVSGNNYPGIANFSVNGNAIIEAGGGIVTDASASQQNVGSGRGFFYGSTPYYQCSGAGHGGYGAIGYTNQPVLGGSTYDSTPSPTSQGSGGGGSGLSFGGSGGGYVRLTVNGTLQLDGIVTANGGNGSGIGGGGGSGGSTQILPGVFKGAGSVNANGGNGATYGGGGGGGRIALYYSSNNDFTGAITAFGGGGFAYGGAGTIYSKTNSQQYGQLLLDNANNPGTNTSFDFDNLDVTVQNKAIGVLPASGTWFTHNILIRTNGVLAAPASVNSRSLLANDLTIDPGGALTGDSAGNGAQAGFGYGNYVSATLRGGGGHGGNGGGNSGGRGLPYGSIQFPATAGSGGGSFYNGNGTSNNGGSGGGALTLNISGALTVNGRLTANGGNGDFNAGGGSGGSLSFSFINQFHGSGIISANGGSATGAAGGGSGGRIAFGNINSNDFSGQITAYGGNALFPGAAGTVFRRINGTPTLMVDNGGLLATNTPLGSSFSMPAGTFDLNISGTATVVPASPLPLINNLNLAAGSTLTMPVVRSNLFIAVQHNANVGGNINLDYLGYAQANGPGAGGTLSVKGGGGGYGGAGGNASSGALGGVTNGSASQPVSFGSGGGQGFASITGGSEGGGAVRISVGGTLNLDGNLTANGDYGWQDDSGGGAGGSIWITANKFTGTGILGAMGGNGDLWNGGGGGGRIAIYSPTNLFTGITNVIGGFGWVNGQPGSVFLAATPIDFLILSQSPTGAVNNTVSYVDLSFNEAVDPNSLLGSAFTFTTPAGVMDSANLSFSSLNPTAIRVSFPVQNLVGNYSLQVAPALTSILGQPLAQSFTGNFSISLPMISGTVSDTNGAPVPGVTLQPDGGLIGTITDTNGYYAIGVPPGWNGNITPSLGDYIFVPGTLSYTNVTLVTTNQNYLMVVTITPNLTTSVSGTNLSLAWTGINGVTYQTWASTNLVDWTLYGNAISGTNGPMQYNLPLDGSPARFFRLGASH